MSELPVGAILPWPSTDPAPTGWHVCDGADGTLDLRGKFIPCAGGTAYAVGDSGGSATFVIPAHTHETVEPFDANENDGAHQHATVTIQTEAASGSAGSVSGGAKATWDGTSHYHTIQASYDSDGQHGHYASGVSGTCSPVSLEKLPPFVAVQFIQRLS